MSLASLQPSLRTSYMPLYSSENLGWFEAPTKISSKLVSLLATYFFFINKIRGLKIPSMSIYRNVYCLLISDLSSSATFFKFFSFSTSVVSSSVFKSYGWIINESVSP